MTLGDVPGIIAAWRDEEAKEEQRARKRRAEQERKRRAEQERRLAEQREREHQETEAHRRANPTCQCDPCKGVPAGGAMTACWPYPEKPHLCGAPALPLDGDRCVLGAPSPSSSASRRPRWMCRSDELTVPAVPAVQ